MASASKSAAVESELERNDFIDAETEEEAEGEA